MRSSIPSALLVGLLVAAAGCSNGVYGQKKEVLLEYLGVRISQPHVLPSIATGTRFGLVPQGSFEAHTFRVTNQKNGTIAFQATPTVWIEGSEADDFVLTQALPTELETNTYAEFTIEFRPLAAGIRSAIVLIPFKEANGVPGTLQLTLVGEGDAALPVVGEIDVQNPSGITIQNGDDGPTTGKETDFGDLDPSLFETETRTFTIKNTHATGNLSLLSTPTVYVVGNNADQFSLSALPVDGATIAPLGSATFSITFEPTMPGVMEATIVIISDDTDEGFFWFSIKGTGATTT